MSRYTRHLRHFLPDALQMCQTPDTWRMDLPRVLTAACVAAMDVLCNAGGPATKRGAAWLFPSRSMIHSSTK